MERDLRVRHLKDNTYEVVKLYPSFEDGGYDYEDECIVYEGSISDCESYIRLKNADLFI